MLTVVTVLVVLGIGFVAVAATGAVNVAATQAPLPGVDWFFSTLSGRSIDEHAEAAA